MKTSRDIHNMLKRRGIDIAICHIWATARRRGFQPQKGSYRYHLTDEEAQAFVEAQVEHMESGRYGKPVPSERSQDFGISPNTPNLHKHQYKKEEWDKMVEDINLDLSPRIKELLGL